jgi:dipeptidyl aminopeptidase/acylaminoacyl peptidase
MPLLRTTFKNQIVTEFLSSSKPSNKVIIICDGLPSLPHKKRLMEFLSKKGFWVFHIRYRGTWESGGEFLVCEPQHDVLDILDEVPKGFKSIWDGVEYRVDPTEVYVFGSSFGGCTALMASLDERITKVIAVSPVVDWLQESPEESHAFLKQVIRGGYGGSYRFNDANWDKLVSGDFFNPVNHEREFDPRKILIVHALDDMVVGYGPVADFVKKLGSVIISRKKGGHLSSSIVMRWGMWRKIRRFIGK